MKGDIMLNLYRYIGFEDFVNLVVLKKDRYNYPANWDDGYEGFLFSNMETEDEIKTLVSKMYYEVCRKNYNAVIDNILKMADYKYITRAQCWTTHAESDAMWRIYSYQNKAVRIKTNYDKLLAHAKELYPNNPVVLEKIIYDADKVMDVQSQNDLMRASRKVYETYLHKRPAFSHESEYRILVGPHALFNCATYIRSCKLKEGFDEWYHGKKDIHYSDDDIIEKLSSILFSFLNNHPDKEDVLAMMNEDKKKDDKDGNDKDDKNKNDKVKINITDFIEGVMVHPKAEDWYVKNIQNFCDEYKLNFEGKSQIYKLKK